jgi:arylsulfatase A-like enzyme
MEVCRHGHLGRRELRQVAFGAGTDGRATTPSSCSPPTTAPPGGRGRGHHRLLRTAGATDTTADLARIDDIGGPTTMPHYPRGWAACGNTPFRLYKINTHAGGHQVPMILAGPGVAESTDDGAAGTWRDQYVHVVDVLPTLLELTGVAAPSERNGKALKAMQGISFAPVLANPAASSTHRAVLRDARPSGLLPQTAGRWSACTTRSPGSPTRSGSCTT